MLKSPKVKFYVQVELVQLEFENEYDLSNSCTMQYFILCYVEFPYF